MSRNSQLLSEKQFRSCHHVYLTLYLLIDNGTVTSGKAEACILINTKNVITAVNNLLYSPVAKMV